MVQRWCKGGYAGLLFLEEAEGRLANVMSIDLKDMQDARSHLRQRLDSRDWWIIVACDKIGIAFLCEVEGAYYTGDAAEDFELCILPPGILPLLPLVGIAMAKKSRMSPAALVEILNSFVGDKAKVSVEHIQDRDVLFPGADDVIDMGIVHALDAWLYGYRPEWN